ncbi:MAG: DUF2023 family protein [Spirochaetales bacterium]|nr:DUF2023 family protein [Spirochaetales bacterium]
MQVFIHHIYELKKGLRRLVLHTCLTEEIPFVEAKLSKDNISYLLHPVSANKVNVFFGEKVCIEVLKKFSTLKLHRITDQEDFILGTLLGYDLKLQCSRFLEKRENTENGNSAVEAI